MVISVLSYLRSKRLVNYFIIFTRLLVGFAFIPSGLTKFYGQPFTTLPLTNPVGYFFDALHRTGVYWQFLGAAQLLTAFLLMSQRWAKIGSLFYFGLILNIWLITIGIGFGNTVFITSAMVLAGISLIVWDLESYLILFQEKYEIPKRPSPHRIDPHWSIFGFGMFIFLASICHIPYIFPSVSLTFLGYVFTPFLICLGGSIWMVWWDTKKQKFLSKNREELNFTSSQMAFDVKKSDPEPPVK